MSARMTIMMTLHSQQASGNAYKPRLLMAQLKIPFRVIDINTYDGSTRKPEFLAVNPIGKVPVLVLDDGRTLAESNAILLYLAEDTRFLPADRYDRGKVYEWLFFEQYTHEPSIAVRRSILTAPERAAQRTPERLQSLLESGNSALAVMERRLAVADWLAGDSLLDRRHRPLRLHPRRPRRRLRPRRLSGNLPLDHSGIAGEPGHVPIGWRP